MTQAEFEALTAALTEREALFLTAWAEARGDAHEGQSSVEERIAVMCVCRNRVTRGDRSYRLVCLERNQFSCWTFSATDPNHLALVALAQRVVHGLPLIDPIARETAFLAGGVIDGDIVDRTGGATHYYAPASMVPANRVPRWAANQTPTAQIGRQIFFQLA